MAVEIERKFLVHPTAWDKLAKPEPEYLRQGYLSGAGGTTVRIRTTATQAWITIKGKSSANGLSRLEYEYTLPMEDAREMLDALCGESIEKWRYTIPAGELNWEVDVFLGENKGLIVAEIEVRTEEEMFNIPDWIAEEVTGDKRYYNSFLAMNPFTKW